MPPEPLDTIPFRSRAEKIASQIAAQQQQRPLKEMSIDEMRAINHELQVQQIELELQNEELRRVSGELSRSQRRFFNLFDLAPVGYLVINEAGMIEEVNQTFCKLVQRERDQVIYQPFASFIVDSDRAAFLDRFHAYYDNPTNQMVMLRLLKAGSFFHARLEGTFITAFGEQLTEESPHLLLTVSDISDRVQVEHALQQSEERFHQLADNITEIFWLSDISTRRIIYVSPAYETVWGYPARTAIDRPLSFFEYIHPEDRERVAQINPIVADTGQPYELEFRIVRPDGQVRWLWARSFPVFGEGGQVSRLAGVAADITSRKVAEDDLRATLYENRLLLKELEGRVTKSLNLIAGIVRLESDQFSHPAVNAAMAGVNRRVQMLSDLYNELYRGGNLHQVDLKKYFERIVSSLGASVGSGSGRREILLRCQPVQVEVDLAAGLGLILNELISNSLKHAFASDEPGRVQAELRQEGSRLFLEVQDNGRGLPDDLNLLATPRLGLQLVQWLARQMHGTFTISARTPARFQVEIPIS